MFASAAAAIARCVDAADPSLRPQKPPGAAMTRCECGQPRDPCASACTSCISLDDLALAPSLHRVLSTLQSLGGFATREALELETQMAARSLRRACAKLERLRRIVIDHDRDEENRNRVTFKLRERRTVKPKASDDNSTPGNQLGTTIRDDS